MMVMFLLLLLLSKSKRQSLQTRTKMAFFSLWKWTDSFCVGLWYSNVAIKFSSEVMVLALCVNGHFWRLANIINTKATSTTTNIKQKLKTFSGCCTQVVCKNWIEPTNKILPAPSRLVISVHWMAHQRKLVSLV